MIFQDLTPIPSFQGISTPIMCTPEELMEVEHED